MLQWSTVEAQHLHVLNFVVFGSANHRHTMYLTCFNHHMPIKQAIDLGLILNVFAFCPCQNRSIEADNMHCGTCAHPSVSVAGSPRYLQQQCNLFSCCRLMVTGKHQQHGGVIQHMRKLNANLNKNQISGVKMKTIPELDQNKANG